MGDPRDHSDEIESRQERDGDAGEKTAPIDHGDLPTPDELVVTEINDDALDRAVEEALEREKQYFRLTRGQRKALVGRRWRH